MRITNLPSGSLGANTYLVVDEETKKGFIVDPGGYLETMAKMVQVEGVDLEYIILTHGHGDHIGGVPEYKKQFPNVKIAASKEEVDFLADPELNLSEYTVGTPVSVIVDVPLEDGDELIVGNMDIKII
ncbi:MAG: MBL fold metallo-hydrolase, partial [Anaerovoracaceae bacterium]